MLFIWCHVCHYNHNFVVMQCKTAAFLRPGRCLHCVPQVCHKWKITIGLQHHTHEANTVLPAWQLLLPIPLITYIHTHLHADNVHALTCEHNTTDTVIRRLFCKCCVQRSGSYSEADTERKKETSTEVRGGRAGLMNNCVDVTLSCFTARSCNVVILIHRAGESPALPSQRTDV